MRTVEKRVSCHSRKMEDCCIAKSLLPMAAQDLTTQTHAFFFSPKYNSAFWVLKIGPQILLPRGHTQGPKARKSLTPKTHSPCLERNPVQPSLPPNLAPARKRETASQLKPLAHLGSWLCYGVVWLIVSPPPHPNTTKTYRPPTPKLSPNISGGSPTQPSRPDPQQV